MTDSLFPELGGRVVLQQLLDPPREGAYEEAGTPEIVKVPLGPSGRAQRGSDWALNKWRQLLGMDAMPTRDERLALNVAEVNLSDGHIKLCLQGRKIGQPEVHLLPCRRGSSDALSICVALRGAVPNEAVQSLLSYIQQRLAPAPYETLLKVFRLDPEAQTVAAEASAMGDDPRFAELVRRSVVRTLHGAVAWRVFHAELEQQRNFNHYLMGNILVIKHEDLECGFATPPVRADTLSFFNYSRIHLSKAKRHRPAPPSHEPPSPPPSTAPWGEVATDLKDADVIGGGVSKVEQLLHRVASSEERPDLVIVKTSCVPKVIGDDLGPALQRFEARTGVPTVFLDNLSDEREDYFSTLLDRLRWEPEFADPLEVKRRINLVGFPRGGEMDRLVGMLERLGITINAQLVPQIRLDDLRRYTWAELQVLFDSHLYRSSFQQIIGNTTIASLYTVPPFGVLGTRRWIGEIAAALGVEEAACDSVWEEAWKSFAPAWKVQTGRARRCGLGFVLDQRSVTLLLDPAESTGVPMLACLEEMGFALEFLLYRDVAEDVSLPGRRTRFGTAAELETRLRQSQAAAFYSEFYFDRRLSRCGKTQFSVADFQLGLGGALQTLQRLLQICELPFYRRFGGYLGEPFTAGQEEE